MNSPESDPTRLLDDPSVGPGVRAALRSYSQVVPPHGAEAAVKAQVASKVIAAKLAGLATKVVIGVLAISAGVGVYRWNQSPSLETATTKVEVPPMVAPVDEPSPPAAPEVSPPPEVAAVPPLMQKGASAPARRRRVEPVAQPAVTAPEPAAAEVPDAPPPAPPKPKPNSSASLAAEAALLEEAQRALDSKDAARARALIAQARREFGNGQLEQERDALEVEALWLQGDKVAARRAAETFLKAFAASPHSARMRSFIGQ
jgi:hypothetical protein